MPTQGPTPTPLAPDAPHPLPRLPSPSPTPLDWIPVLALPVHFSLDHFHQGLIELVLKPELSSSTILRADILADDDYVDGNHGQEGKESQPTPAVDLDGFDCVRRVRRRILPNRPQFDKPLDQECLFYERPLPSQPSSSTSDAQGEGSREGLLLLLPDHEQLRRDDPEGSGKLPYYHPQVWAVAFRFFPRSQSPSSASPASASLRIDLVPLPSDSLSVPSPGPTSLAQSDRLYRTSLALVKFAAKLCAGKADGWQKRIHHDLLVGKEEVQDLYQALKDKYKTDLSRLSLLPSSDYPRVTFRWLLSEWKEGTDPEKHVFEDVAIAAWLICLWRDMYSETGGRPPGGFVDIGCGNGLLVYLLASEGFTGFGFDLRARKSWSSYSPRPDLRTTSLNPLNLLSSSPFLCSTAPASDSTEPWPFPPDSFLIGNHADEMTPWIPFLAAATPGSKSAFLNIPCCLHELIGRFERQTYSIPPEFLSSLPCPPTPTTRISAQAEGAASEHPHTHPLLQPFYAPSPAELTSGGRYIAYQLYLAHLTLVCGFIPEREALRIPSTKNFGMVGRKRVEQGEDGKREEGLEGEVRERIREVLGEVGRKGEWRARKPEGKAGGH
ncbi:hypothetical protein JCM11641_001539 [Rhodosporidiobolus odoratus]